MPARGTEAGAYVGRTPSSGAMATRFLTARWAHLLMASYAVPADVLQPLVPAGTRLDLWRGQALASVVGFRFLGTRVLGVPVPFHRDFEEVNLRFYVVREVDGDVRRGVVFVRENVPRTAIAAVARALYNEPYVALPMGHDVRERGVPPLVAYRWKRNGRWESLSAVLAGDPARPADGSQAAFITGHYWGYTAQRDGSTIEYRVEHVPWRVWEATDLRLDADVAGLYGAAFAPALAAAPVSVLVAEGSPVSVRLGARIRRGGPRAPAAGPA